MVVVQCHSSDVQQLTNEFVDMCMYHSTNHQQIKVFANEIRIFEKYYFDRSYKIGVFVCITGNFLLVAHLMNNARTDIIIFNNLWVHIES